MILLLSGWDEVRLKKRMGKAPSGSIPPALRAVCRSVADSPHVLPVRPERSRGTLPSAAEALFLDSARKGVSTSLDTNEVKRF